MIDPEHRSDPSVADDEWSEPVVPLDGDDPSGDTTDPGDGHAPPVD